MTAPTPGRDANRAGLRYTRDTRPGIRRRRSGRGFSYQEPDGRLVRATSEIQRIRALAIPPAWTDVWICPDPDGHLQATGRDARGRKQYRYHPRWRRRRDAGKFRRLAVFAQALPSIRRACDADLARSGLPREKVLAAIVRLLELTLIRVGNEEYARANRSFGLTTLRARHVRVAGSEIRFRFRGKSGTAHEVLVRDRRLAGIVRRCTDLPGRGLFRYVDDAGAIQEVTSADVNDYLRAISGSDFTAKDFRTWAGTVLAFRALGTPDPDSTLAGRRRDVAAAMRATADGLGNTPAVARGSYVHPVVIETYLEGSLPAATSAPDQRTGDAPTPATEAETVAILELIDG